MTPAAVVLIDLENVVGVMSKPPIMRSRVAQLLDAAQPYHHAVAAYAASDLQPETAETIASTLASLGVARCRSPQARTLPRVPCCATPNGCA